MNERKFYFRVNDSHVQFIFELEGRGCHTAQLNLPVYLSPWQWDSEKELPVKKHPKFAAYAELIDQTRKEYIRVTEDLKNANLVHDFFNVSHRWGKVIEIARVINKDVSRL